MTDNKTKRINKLKKKNPELQDTMFQTEKNQKYKENFSKFWTIN